MISSEVTSELEKLPYRALLSADRTAASGPSRTNVCSDAHISEKHVVKDNKIKPYSHQ